MSNAKKPMVLVILDGYGYREDQQDNAILNAKRPVMNRLWAEYPHTLISASGLDVGLPDGQMGNSEVGHVNLGAGRIVYQDLTRLDKEIKEGDFYSNAALTRAVDDAVAAGKAVHIMGLMSPGGVHSHEDHILAMVDLAAQRGAEAIYLHAFLDGRDTPPRSAESTLKRFNDHFTELGKGRIASLIGRYYAMDRDNRWDRVELAYDLLTDAKGEFHADNAIDGLQAAYARGENDEFVKPTVIRTSDQADAAMQDGDALIFMNFRADRARQITRAFVNADFDGFARRKTVRLGSFIMLTEYAADIKTECAYPPASLSNTLGEWLMKHHKTQLRISETEKYAHVTFFYNGGVEDPFNGEDRILINSPKVATYDLQPEMSSAELTEKLVSAISSGKYDTIICNYPNGDMVGHTGVYDAAIKAVEALDICIGQVVDAVQKADGQLLITADHGNAELMRDQESGQPYTAHTNLPVPLIYIGKQASAVEGGKLSDIAPTMLTLMGMEVPQEMTGKPLFIVK
ncbi:2,3-bisphosphoglycerate-independent phosphoglycerate mutase [Edwardsiella ictaluri]|uniref:2,3-bisphosphoglycerate-independent phosphoglycerate mutase n=2 Tax=Edwardsiella ictaluri TaxID=67780 RepID=C5BC37_EDWI9|nr:2,3-bisphosphoglycerate-independent phosphoglycerate mutase [Edwardsiella ictaluri]ACR70943.1 2,3-bisphosphoglycerate-independent phosphoglycerate mutase, putative [Edwardsiella ictaluri 93-146]AVZ82294.1 2,3-bisphosphoglycerate-independent phosphoglycerate mutase [Edwardsiella ictaluri]EKS7762833.1 2,3-bisphosphoglycerate-independent phosphoglycerate mutase [Edwardsiella ictaluri]EKS7769745.1 2,3-bisphosphoglycerate-independent phosphoglycerate mutase [Edwardsiella ictaluri]EKS7772798.1 2,